MAARERVVAYAQCADGPAPTHRARCDSYCLALPEASFPPRPDPTIVCPQSLGQRSMVAIAARLLCPRSSGADGSWPRRRLECWRYMRRVFARRTAGTNRW